MQHPGLHMENASQMLVEFFIAEFDVLGRGTKEPICMLDICVCGSSDFRSCPNNAKAMS